MPHCDAVVTHAGHGTLMRSLACGVPVVACPAAGDMGENAARVEWAGVGVAMGDGAPSLQAIADWVAPRQAEDGVAAALERFVLG